MKDAEWCESSGVPEILLERVRAWEAKNFQETRQEYDCRALATEVCLWLAAHPVSEQASERESDEQLFAAAAARMRAAGRCFVGEPRWPR